MGWKLTELLGLKGNNCRSMFLWCPKQGPSGIDTEPILFNWPACWRKFFSVQHEWVHTESIVPKLKITSVTWSSFSCYRSSSQVSTVWGFVLSSAWAYFTTEVDHWLSVGQAIEFTRLPQNYIAHRKLQQYSAYLFSAFSSQVSRLCKISVAQFMAF